MSNSTHLNVYKIAIVKMIKFIEWNTYYIGNAS